VDYPRRDTSSRPKHLQLDCRGMATRSKKSSKPKAMTKSQMASDIAGKTGLTKAQVQSVLAAQLDIISVELNAGRPVSLPGLVKITLHRKAASPARPGINPFTKEPITIKAKPARTVVRVRPLKALKSMV
jgi:nucleoid DNA-binding protein